MEIWRSNSTISPSRRMPGWSSSRSTCARIDFTRLVRRAFAGGPTWGDFGVVAMVRVVIGLVVVGGRRLRHVAYVADDPVVQRFGGVRVMPTARTLSRWLTRFTMPTVRRLQALNAAVVTQVLSGLGLRTWRADAIACRSGTRRISTPRARPSNDA